MIPLLFVTLLSSGMLLIAVAIAVMLLDTRVSRLEARQPPPACVPERRKPVPLPSGLEDGERSA